MNYKKIFKNQKVRFVILKLLCFIPDKMMLKLQYKIKTGRKLNLKNPLRYTEKIQWYKLYYRSPLMIKCVDKYDVREYVKEKKLIFLLNECYGVFNCAKEINFSDMPDSFVIKDTLGGGSSSVIAVRHKSDLDLNSVFKTINSWVNSTSHLRDGGREWPYYSGKRRRIIVEKYLEQNDGDLADYKFYCFNGKVKLI